MTTATGTDVGPANAPRPRGVLGRFVDRAFGAVAGLPRTAGDYVLTKGVSVPMRDGVELLTDHYAPAGPTAGGTVLVRCPYGRTGVGSVLFGRFFADQGYHVLIQSCRGTFGSGGAFDPMRNEIEDGHDTVAWLREQPWFDGRLGTAGASYLGFVQWALLMDPPPELKAAIVMVGPHDMHRTTWGTGSFSLDDFFGWSEMMVHQEDPWGPQRVARMVGTQRRLAPGENGLPLLDAGERLLLGKAPWYREWLGRPDPDDPYWAPMRLAAALERVEVPVLLQSGWMDLFLDQSLDQYARLRERGVEVGLTVGPWTHTGTVGAVRTVVREQVAWLDEHVAGRRSAARPAPVRVFVTGADGGWRGLPSWPPVAASSAARPSETLYLLPHGGLGAEAPAAGEQPAAFTYDPTDPTPSLGGRLLGAGVAGYQDSRPLAARSDVVTFTGAPLTEALEVMGTPVVELAHRSDNPHADLFVRICDVAPDGRATNVSDTFRRLDPQQAGSDVTLRLDACAHRFAAGHRVQVLVAGGAHPRYARNLGTGRPQAGGTATRPSLRTIELGASRVTLPVVGR